MPLSFSLHLDVLTALGSHDQLFLQAILEATRGLDQYANPLGAQVAKLAKEGIRSTPAASVSEKDVLCVVDDGRFPVGEGGRVGVYIEFLLNGKYYRLTTGYKPNPGSSIGPAGAYPPEQVKAITLPTKLANAVGKVVPAPINKPDIKDVAPRSEQGVTKEFYILNSVAVSDQESKTGGGQFYTLQGGGA
jgi:hypothetical protein